jgi:hypothetical protein
MLVIVEDGGGLANRLFVFANVIATGLGNGHRVANPAFRHWAESFEGTSGDLLSVYPRRRRSAFGGRISAKIASSIAYRSTRFLSTRSASGPLQAIRLRWPDHCDLDDGYMAGRIRRARVVLFKGWLFRNRTAVMHYQEILREFFRPVAPLRREAERTVKVARGKGDFLVGVHVRHRDYRDFMGGRYFYEFEAYVALMRSVATLLAPRRPAFLVCSDEVQEVSVAGDLSMTTSTMGPVQDLWALSQCDLLIGPPSTFSTWAAFLGCVPRWEITNSEAEPKLEAFVVPLPIPQLPDESV